MAQKAKSLYVSIVDTKTHKTVINKVFLNAKSANEWITIQLETYKRPEYYYVKETY